MTSFRRNTASELNLEEKYSPLFELTPQQNADIREVFNLLNIQGTGFISVNDMKIVWRILGHEPKRRDIERTLKKARLDKNGQLDFDGFKKIMYMKMCEKSDVEEILKAFDLFDANGKGVIDLTDLKRVSQQIGESISDDELLQMIKVADSSGDDVVTLTEFKAVMKIKKPIEYYQQLKKKWIEK